MNGSRSQGKIDPLAAKAESERVEMRLGGRVLDGLPWLDRTVHRAHWYAREGK